PSKKIYSYFTLELGTWFHNQYWTQFSYFTNITPWIYWCYTFLTACWLLAVLIAHFAACWLFLSRSRLRCGEGGKKRLLETEVHGAMTGAQLALQHADQSG
uniref:Glycerophosphocholine acyltransferase 1 n=1 Tax=Aegilops tauschii subsp. strangulata TaxID=200361 RepID=A0A453NS54_AEGTS